VVLCYQRALTGLLVGRPTVAVLDCDVHDCTSEVGVQIFAGELGEIARDLNRVVAPWREDGDIVGTASSSLLEMTL
jgi:hypothetical protein